MAKKIPVPTLDISESEFAPVLFAEKKRTAQLEDRKDFLKDRITEKMPELLRSPRYVRNDFENGVTVTVTPPRFVSRFSQKLAEEYLSANGLTEKAEAAGVIAGKTEIGTRVLFKDKGIDPKVNEQIAEHIADKDLSEICFMYTDLLAEYKLHYDRAEEASKNVSAEMSFRLSETPEKKLKIVSGGDSITVSEKTSRSILPDAFARFAGDAAYTSALMPVEYKEPTVQIMTTESYLALQESIARAKAAKATEKAEADADFAL